MNDSVDTNINHPRFRIRPLFLEIFVFLIFVAIVSYFFPDMVYMGKIPNGGDVNGLYFPQLKFLGDELHAGRFPFWNPYIFSGTPFFSNIHTGAAHLPHLILLSLFSPERAFGLDIALHFILAGWFTYLLLRLYKISRSSALLSGICYMLSEFVLTKILIPRGFFSAPFFPLAFFAIEYITQKKCFRSYVIGTIAGVFLLLCGDPQTIYTIALASIIYIIGRWLVEFVKIEIRENPLKLAGLLGNILILCFIASLFWLMSIEIFQSSQSNKLPYFLTILFGFLSVVYVILIRSGSIQVQWKSMSLTLGILITSGIVSFGLASIQLIPAFKLLPDTVRANYPNEGYFRIVSFLRLWQAILHDFFVGGGMGDFEISAYIGTLPFLLILGGLFLPSTDKKNRFIQMIYLLLACWSLCIVFYEPTLTNFFVMHIPKFSTFFVLHRYLLVYALASSVLAGFALDKFLKYRDSTPLISTPLLGYSIWALGLFIFLSCTGLGNIGYRIFPGVLIIFLYLLSPVRLFPKWLFVLGVLSLSLIELTPEYAGYDKEISYISPKNLYPKNEVSDFFSKETSMFRYYSIEDTTRQAPTNHAPILSDLILPNTAVVYKFYDTQGFDPIFLKLYRTLINRINQNQSQRNPYDDPLHYAVINLSNSLLISLLNVKYILSEKPLEGYEHSLAQDGITKIYQNKLSTPRAVLVHRVRVTSQDNQAWQWLEMPKFDPRKTAVLNGNLGKLVEYRSNEIGKTGKKFPAGHSVRVLSSSPGAGDIVRILIDNQDIVENYPGYTLVVMTPDGDLESTENYRTTESIEEANRLIQYISSLDTGKIVLVASRRNADQFMSPEMLAAFQSIGAEGVPHPYDSASSAHVIIGIKGATPGQAMELNDLPTAELMVPFSIPVTYRYDIDLPADIEEPQKVEIPSIPVKDSVSIIKYLPNQIIYRTSSNLPGILIMSEIYHSDWQVYMDKKLGDLVRANGAFRAVYVPKGDHIVELNYWPKGMTQGIIISSITFLLFLISIAIRIGILLSQRKQKKLEQQLIQKAEEIQTAL